ncbi:mast cell protease 1A [Denticeps clupeoides]|uniref:trypsin n=1 Tax=Denticeps clupeoides TaxID=299321 RepID=A0AAY4C9P8_9TELE|nr:mast cell protease 1A-like [Denticeps clupeoides]
MAGRLIMSASLYLLFTQGACMRAGIIGGHAAVPHSHPYMVYLWKGVPPDGKPCEGFLVSENYVMTAAHCDGRTITAYSGAHDVSDLSSIQSVAVEETFPHADFNSLYDNDIMLLQLQKNITLNKYIQSINLPKTEDEGVPKHCLVAGWGCEDTNCTLPTPEVLKEVNVTVSDIYSDLILTDGPNGPGNGDSGGPLVCNGVAYGVVSTRRDENETDYFFTYTRISHYLAWINKFLNHSTQANVYT